jgi:hypothetical protein
MNKHFPVMSGVRTSNACKLFVKIKFVVFCQWYTLITEQYVKQHVLFIANKHRRNGFEFSFSCSCKLVHKSSFLRVIVCAGTSDMFWKNIIVSPLCYSTLAKLLHFTDSPSAKGLPSLVNCSATLLLILVPAAVWSRRSSRFCCRLEVSSQWVFFLFILVAK